MLLFSRRRFSPVAGWVAFTGAVLALGAPVGWYLLEHLGAHEPRPAVLYAYLFIAPLVVMTIGAALLGEALDRSRARVLRLEEMNRRYQELATTDTLTGLRNRRYFEDRLREECARSDRSFQPLALITLDLDHFKGINDAWGHPVGDQVLAHASRILAGSVRTCDVACRVGGEEFAVLCPGAREEEARRVAERVRQSLERTPLRVNGHRVGITVSLGVAVREPDSGTEDLVRQADMALYRAKAAGRNRVEVAPPEPIRPPSLAPLAAH